MGNTQVAKTAPDYGPDYLSAYDSKGPHHTSKPDGQLPVRYAKGEGSHVVLHERYHACLVIVVRSIRRTEGRVLCGNRLENRVKFLYVYWW